MILNAIHHMKAYQILVKLVVGLFLLLLAPSCNRAVPVTQQLQINVEEGDFQMMRNERDVKVYKILKGKDAAVELAKQCGLKRYEGGTYTTPEGPIKPPYFVSAVPNLVSPGRLVSVGPLESGNWILVIHKY